MIISVDDFSLEASEKCEKDYVEIRYHGIPISGPKSVFSYQAQFQ
jgi:hypothetical protein